jgi:hypothetical protein
MAIIATNVTKTALALTREEAAEVVKYFAEIWEDPKVTKIALVFDPTRFVTSNCWAEHDEVECAFIAVE